MASVQAQPVSVETGTPPCPRRRTRLSSSQTHLESATERDLRPDGPHEVLSGLCSVVQLLHADHLNYGQQLSRKLRDIFLSHKADILQCSGVLHAGHVLRWASCSTI